MIIERLKPSYEVHLSDSELAEIDRGAEIVGPRMEKEYGPFVKKSDNHVMSYVDGIKHGGRIELACHKIFEIEGFTHHSNFVFDQKNEPGLPDMVLEQPIDGVTTVGFTDRADHYGRSVIEDVLMVVSFPEKSRGNTFRVSFQDELLVNLPLKYPSGGKPLARYLPTLADIQAKGHDWLQTQLEGLVRFAFDHEMDLIQLNPMSKNPIQREDFYQPALSLSQALVLVHSSTVHRVNGFGVRGTHTESDPRLSLPFSRPPGMLSQRKTYKYCFIDFDSICLSPILQRLASLTPTIVTPNGYTFVIESEPFFDYKLATRVLQHIFSDNPEQIEKLSQKQLERRLSRIFRFGQYYVCYPGTVTCLNQTRAVGMEHGPNAHSDPDRPCNGSPDGQHRYFMRTWFKPSGNYSSLVPDSDWRILSFSNFVEEWLEGDSHHK
jgi:hypothetical protein